MPSPVSGRQTIRFLRTSYPIRVAEYKKDVTTRELLENLPEYKRDSMHKGLAILQEKGMILKKGASVSSRYVFCPTTLERSGFSKEVQVFMDIANRGQKG